MSVGVDWLSFTLPDSTPHGAMSLLGAQMQGDFVRLPRGRFGYECEAVGPNGALVLWSRHRKDVHCSLPGKACRAIDEEQMRGLLAVVAATGKATRCDLACDDWRRRVSPVEVYDSLERGNGVTRCREWDITLNNHKGMTCYVGSKKSIQLLRVYDKKVESRGEIDSIRWELVLRKGAAVAVVELLYRRRWAAVLRLFLVSLVDFRDRSVDANVGRCPRLPWYASLVEDARRAKVLAASPPRTLEEMMRYLKKQFGPSFATVIEAKGGDMEFVYELLADGKMRLKSKHLSIIASAMSEPVAEEP